MKIVTFLSILFFLSSCVMNSRMTSPQTLDKEERIWTYGLIFEPTAYDSYAEEIYRFQPIIGYRSGINSNNDIGINLYGVITPGFTIDWKHKYIEKNNFILSGDLAAFTGIYRPSGIQYDLLFGNRGFYGITGINYEIFHLNTDKPSIVLGFGSDISKNTKFGFQILFMRSMPDHLPDGNLKYPFTTITIGVKVDFLKIKRKYRN